MCRVCGGRSCRDVSPQRLNRVEDTEEIQTIFKENELRTSTSHQLSKKISNARAAQVGTALRSDPFSSTCML